MANKHTHTRARGLPEPEHSVPELPIDERLEQHGQRQQQRRDSHLEADDERNGERELGQLRPDVVVTVAGRTCVMMTKVIQACRER